MGKGSSAPKQVGTQNTISTSEPWGPTQPYLKDAYQGAQDLFQSGGPSYYPNATYTPFSGQTELGLNMMQGRALQGSPLQDAAQQQAQGTIGGNYLYNQPGMAAGRSMMGQAGYVPGQGAIDQAYGSQDPSQNFLQGSMRTATQDPTKGFLQGQRAMSGYDPSANYLQGQMNANPNATPAQGYLGNAASGGMLGSNPYLDAEYEKASRGVQSGINAAFGGGGRTGSEAHASSLGTGMADLATRLYGSNYGRERGLQQQAAGQIQRAYDTSQGRGLQGAGQLTQGLRSGQGLGLNAAQQQMQNLRSGQGLGLQGAGQLTQGYNRDIANALQGTGLEQQGYMGSMGLGMQGANLGQNAFANERRNMMQGTAMAPTLAQMDYQDIGQLLGVGGQVEQQGQRQLQDSMNRYNFYQNRPDQQLQNYAATVLGNVGQLGGTRSGQQPIYGSNGGGFSGAMGGALGGAGLANMLSLSNPVSAGLAGLGALGGMK